jgi:hypothetical protein
MKTIQVMLVLTGVIAASASNTFGTVITSWTPIDDPFAGTGLGQGTYPRGVFGNKVVGYYIDSVNVAHGFIYNGGTYTTLDSPLAGTSAGQGTFASGISGSNIVGYVYGATASGFIYNGTTFTYLNDPAVKSNGTQATAIDGSNIVGWYDGARINNPNQVSNVGFLYDGTTWTELDDSFAVFGTYPMGISSSKIVGYFTDSLNYDHGFVYNGVNYTELNDPLAGNVLQHEGTRALGISGNNIVGGYRDSNFAHPLYHGFLYDGANWTTLDISGSETQVNGINGNNIVGFYGALSSGAAAHGFLTSVPEPSALSLALVASAAYIGCRFRRASVRR